jgi:hypothetical protein
LRKIINLAIARQIGKERKAKIQKPQQGNILKNVPFVRMT